MSTGSEAGAGWRKHLSPAERRKITVLDAEIAALEATVDQQRLTALRQERRRIMKRANTRRYLAERRK